VQFNILKVLFSIETNRNGLALRLLMLRRDDGGESECKKEERIFGTLCV
jgi:hypothetical protein